MPPEAVRAVPPARRINSVDQFRGYAIFGMVLVNFLGMFDVMPWMLKHHRIGMSYADTIAPVFIFVVGMMFRLSLEKRYAKAGRSAYKEAARRYLILIAIGIVYGGFSFDVAIWDALTDIGFAGLLALPWMLRPGWVRAAMAVVYLGAYQALFTWTPYGVWQMANSINGGPLGPLSWAFILLMGTLAYDIIATRSTRRIVWLSLAWGSGLCLAGWLLRMPWGSVKDFWAFSQYGMTMPYPVYATGLAFLTYLAFFVVNDLFRVTLPHLTALGRNPLALYLLQAALMILAELFLPGDLGFWWVLFAFAVVYGVVYGVARFLDQRDIVLKIG
jgi:predicted acyltransferase